MALQFRFADARDARPAYAVLVYPVMEKSLREPIGLLLALCCALGWAGGTVYMKWARIKGDLLAISFWQIMVGVTAFFFGYLFFVGVPHYEPLQWRTWGGLLFNGILGTGIAYFIWFNIIGRLTTVMASLGSLINPVVGVIGAAILLGGFRGRPPGDLSALTSALEAIGDFAWAERESLEELDVNPIVVREKGAGCVVVDALIVPRPGA